MKYELPKLEYGYDSLEPYIDAKTMEIHHTKHHQGYIDKLDAVLEKYPTIADKRLGDLIKELPTLAIDETDKTVLKNNGGGHLNHSLFWQIMSPQKNIDTTLAEEITKTFNSTDEFKKLFSDTTTKHFGSGWAWLVRDEGGALKVYSLPNQDSPLALGHTPIFGLDIWEHAYYLKYQNRRAEYVDNWWNVLKLL
ncbi:superoxide dismutase [Candidatus Azambacteria bacterium RIFOXYD1_FULL_42_11]|uniref:Superoxide dismutase n=3 Tax=Candidatus Azamiibacteriota TaxID=1752741 RepID=A0A0G1CAI1_9BACT|nr:MAG: Superoxide dismutase [Candidatus Azambacteria bacterium GW2011_GWA1_42_19]KKS75812.1 MAG: Superoxide dismutase [Candidatus Azambacteria bacterium GW2011_GWA2_42_9]KKS88924.1 MAG: Superoxide dismutase [Parcubacteria group bacterium GW2011_GWC1_43_11]OGD41772.1 MAG: superoxide dismutase [Candidatus Azambacteria bacterium RIFOXYD1_FULL_42_11]